jgi:sulfite exporter TauE/SafE
LVLEQLLVGLSLGLTSGVGCGITCIPILVPRVAGGGPGLRQALATTVSFSIGKFVSYSILGVLVSLLGRVALEQFGSTNFHPIILFILGIVMVIYGVSLTGGVRLGFTKSCQYFNGNHTTLFLGFVSSFSLCVPLIVSLVYVMDLGDLTLGMLFMTTFWLGTTIYMLAVGALVAGFLRVGVSQVSLSRIRRIVGYASVMIGIVFLLSGLGFLTTPNII